MEPIIVYSSVKESPDLDPYPKGAESISLVYPTGDREQLLNMTNLAKYSENPILPGGPSDNLVAWRDPYVADWPALDKVLGNQEGQNSYGVVAGGYKDIGPALFFYQVPKDNITNWTYLGDLGSEQGVWNESLNSPSNWSADINDIFEVTNFFSSSTGVEDETGEEQRVARDFIVTGTCVVGAGGGDTKPPVRPDCHNIFMSGEFTTDGSSDANNNTLRFTPNMTGYVDRGNYYAMNGYYNPLIQSMISHGWVTERDMNDEKRAEQGWSGMFALPRKMSLDSVERVTGVLGAELDDLVNIEKQETNQAGVVNVVELQIEPVDDVIDALKDRAKNNKEWDDDDELNAARDGLLLGTAPSHTVILEAQVKFSGPDASPFSVMLRHNEDMSIGTTITFNPANATLTVDRSKSVKADQLEFYNTLPDSTPHALFYTRDDDDDDDDDDENPIELESLDILIVLDHSVIEIFANDRTVLTSRIYTGNEPGTDRITVQSGDGTEIDDLEMWDDISAPVAYV